ncbi:sugar kinase [Roseibium sediminicola]|uniref:Sugar kinase n=1 Tax=Roseibium sediminicola TaxID=2933272 RepID=A0ABT0H116_9HYPH|nr:sugar kinase [Roseibium sp. CAU 1639]MCK7615364.1 sugar kinase [Roseibium sp. CAU 1639]
MARQFVAIGECMVEFAPTLDGTYAVGFAGDTFNTAWYVRQLTERDKLGVTYVSAVGDDDLSRRLTCFVESAGITPAFATIESASPGVYMIFLNNGERSFQYWRSQSAARRLADDLGALEAAAAGDMVYFSGITLAILDETARRRLLSALTDAAGRGAEIVFDPNLRSRLWQSAEDMCAWTTRAASVAAIVLPSFEDEAVHFKDCGPEDTAKRYLECGVRLVVVKNGEGQLVVRSADGDGFQFQPVPVPEVVDTTAAGDSFNAAFLVDYLERGRAREAVRAGCALAAHVIGSRGALVPVSQLDLIACRNRLSA